MLELPFWHKGGKRPRETTSNAELPSARSGQSSSNGDQDDEDRELPGEVGRKRTRYDPTRDVGEASQYVARDASIEQSKS